MKRILFLFLIIFISSYAFAQAPEMMSYQAVIRNAKGELLIQKPIKVRISILQKTESGNSIYVEMHDDTTNIKGLITLKIGDGIIASGNLSTLDWSDGPYFLKTETYYNNVAAYTPPITNISQFLSVPFALYAKTSGNISDEYWSLNGNSINDSNFLGTLNDKPLYIKVNNTHTGYLGNDGNIFFGKDAGIRIPPGGNVAIGRGALRKNGDGIDLVAIGDSALYNDGTRGKNIAVGSKALFNNVIGDRNSAFGNLTLTASVSAGSNTAVGFECLRANTLGSHNTAVGDAALANTTTGWYNTSTGAWALVYNTTGYNNTASGSRVLYRNISGYNNTASGKDALYSNTTGYNNVANGLNSLYSNISGNDNIAIGFSSLYTNTKGRSNTGIGSTSLYSNTIGGANVATGVESMYSNTSGGGNSAIGLSSLRANTSGNYNVALGRESLLTNTSGSRNTAVGYLADVTGNNLINATAIGSGAKVNSSNKVRIGNTSVTKIEGQVAWSFPSDARFKYNIKNDVPGLDFIKKLEPVTYYFDNEKLEEFSKTGLVNKSNIHQVSFTGEKELHTGFLAQDVEKAANDLGYQFDGVRAPENDKDHYSLAYSQFIMPMVKGMQEQQLMIELQNKKIDQQNRNIDQLKEVIQKLEKRMEELNKK